MGGGGSPSHTPIRPTPSCLNGENNRTWYQGRGGVVVLESSTPPESTSPLPVGEGHRAATAQPE